MIRVVALVLLIAASSATATQAQFLGCPLIDQITLQACKVLEKLFYDTDGYNWRNVRGWLRTNQPCDWYGITCRSSRWPREIIHIDLSGNNLTGTLPGDLAFLQELQSLRIDNSGPGVRLRKLTGQIPTTLGDLEYLEVLTLGNNAFTGTIPAELGNLPNLRELSLEANELEGPIPERLGQLLQLQRLDLSENHLGGSIPDTLRNLTKLEYLNLRQNMFTGNLPVWLGDFNMLRFFDASQNQLSGRIPEEFSNLDELLWLSLADNNLEGALSLSIATFAAGINNCDLQGNGVCIPDAPPYANLDQVCSLSRDNACKACEGPNCESLESIYVETGGATWTQNNGWLASSQPCDWHGVNCTGEAITHLILPDNGMVGKLPAALSSMQSLEVLDLSGNNLQGSMPAKYAALTNLDILDLSDNKLTGALPLQVAVLGTKLSQCNLSNNAGICVPDSPEYAALDTSPICHLQLRGDCLGYDLVAVSELKAMPGERSIRLTWSITPSSSAITFFVENTQQPPVTIGQVQGNSEAQTTFTYTVEDLDPGQYSFQIRQVTANGAYRVTGPVTAELYAEGLVTEKAYPNPFSTEAVLQFTSGTYGSVDIALYDLLGRRIQTLFSGTPPLHQSTRIKIKAHGLSAGTYIVRSRIEDQPASSQRIVFVRD
ncbi:MAG: T9SS type A sorting domain-containing protein [Bacteroidetes bacterium]|nr:T9SS type A sorting domain-containing protein [Bacteroidota bacterium]